ncbi:MAG: DUF2887 domain-containing protein [Candidatus Competibacteraceae bacterium]|nr:DUF2887 domain-containing protein [Candidatus Competibacteraceae bacterium]
MKTDTLFYRLFQTYPALALEAAGIIVADPKGYQFQAEEVKETAFRLDGLLVPPPTTPEAPLVFLEAQMQGEDDFYGRFCAEIFLYLYRRTPRHQPWQAVVFYPQRTTERLDARYTALLSLPGFHRVYLEDLAAHPATMGLQLLRLLVTEPEEAQQLAQRLVRQAQADPVALLLPFPDLLNLLETILVYRLPSLTHSEIQAMLGLTHADLKQSRFYQEVFGEGQKEGQKEGLEKGQKEGLEKGQREGLEKGRQEESVMLVLRLLRRRFGALPSVQEERIRSLSLAQAEALAEALLDFQTPGELAAWLDDCYYRP